MCNNKMLFDVFVDNKSEDMNNNDDRNCKMDEKFDWIFELLLSMAIDWWS